MEFPRIALKVSQNDFDQLVKTGNRIDASLTGNAAFVLINPTLIVLRAAITDVEDAIAKWGPKGARGSHEDYVDLCGKAHNLHLIIKEIAQNVSNTAEVSAGTDYAALISLLNTTGFELAKSKTAHLQLETVRDLRNFISRSLMPNQVKLKWKRPLNTSRPSDVTIYDIYRGTTAVFSAAVRIGSSTRCEFLDTNITGVPQSWYYWVVAVNRVSPSAPSAGLQLTVPTI